MQFGSKKSMLLIKKCVVCDSNTGARGVISYFSDKRFYCKKCNSLLYIGTNRKLYWLLYVLLAILSFLVVYFYKVSNLTISIASLISIFVVVAIGYSVSKIYQVK